jgi:hypothetical protein
MESSSDFPGIRNTVANECGVCQRLIAHEALRDETLEIALFGAAKYAWCIACGRTVALRYRTLEYQARWDEFAKAISARVPGRGPLMNAHGVVASVMVGLRGGTPGVRVSVGQSVSWQSFDSLDAAEAHVVNVRGQLVAAGFVNPYQNA